MSTNEIESQTSSKLTDQINILIDKCKKDDRKAQFQLFELFLPYVTVLIRRYLFDQNAVADLSQEVFLTVFNSLKTSYDINKGAFKPWLRKITIHQCLKHNKTIRSIEEIDENTHYIKVEPAVFNAFSEEEMMNLIQSMPTTFRPVFNMAVIDGYPHSEIADLLGLTEAASRKKLSRARAWLSHRIKSSSSLFNAL